MASNIKIAGVEHTQTIQYFNYPAGQGSGYAPDNSVPLVARKPTILRVYADIQQFDVATPVPAWVDGFIWVVNLTTGASGIYNSVNGPLPARAGSAIDRTKKDDTLNFVIPWAISTGQVMYELIVFDPADRGSANVARRFETLNFAAVPALNVHSVLIHYTGVNFFDQPVDAQTNAFNVLFAMDYLLRTYPVSDFRFDGCEVLPWNEKLAVGANFYALSATLGSMRAMSGTDDVFIGLIPPQAGCGGVCGLGGGGSALFFSDNTLNQTGAAHEIGHALGRSHAPGCLPKTDPGDQNYPQYDGFPRASIGECGIDTRTFQVFDPRRVSDYMSYCAPVWTSPYGYTTLLATLQSGAFSDGYGALLATSAAPTVAEYGYLSFRVDRHRDGKDRAVHVLSSFRITRPQPYGDMSQTSDVTVELFDRHDTLLFSTHCFGEVHVDESLPFRQYTCFFPHFAELAKVRLVQADRMLAEYDIAEREPVIEAVELRRTGEGLHLAWKGRAPNATPRLEYGVRFSVDGERWRALRSASTDTEILVDTDLLPGGDECRFEIVASAGFRTTVHQTEPVALDVKPRVAYIASPRPDSEYEVGQPIWCSGTGFSPDFGNCQPDEIVWTCLTVGPLGTGQALLVPSLPAGVHRLTVHVPDGVGGTASTSVTVRVAPRDPCAQAGMPPMILKHRLWPQRGEAL